MEPVTPPDFDAIPDLKQRYRTTRDYLNYLQDERARAERSEALCFLEMKESGMKITDIQVASGLSYSRVYQLIGHGRAWRDHDAQLERSNAR
jgi:hypothetical protein